MGLWITQVVAFWPVYFVLFRIRNWDLTQFSKKDSRFDSGFHIGYSKPTLESLIRQVAGGGDTKAGDIIPQWLMSGGGDTKLAGIIPQWLEMDDLSLWAIRSGMTRTVRNLSGGVCNTSVPHRGD